MLPIYATRANEAMIIADLERTRPPLVVGRSDYWTDSIEDQGLDERTPQLAAWLRRNYLLQTRIDGIELLQRKQ
jgi:hypothetical protein